MINEYPNSKNEAGLSNELLIAGNLAKKGFDTAVLNDHNKDYDIIVIRDKKIAYIECKLDNQAHIYGNFYFEY